MQLIVGVAGLVGLLMMISKNDDVRLFQSWVNSPIQVPWLVMLYEQEQWGFFAIAVGYAAICWYALVRDFTPACQHAFAWWVVLNWWAYDEQDFSRER